MLSMGITLTVDDFKRVLQRPGVMIAGFIGCYGLMPAMALGLSKVLGLPATMTAGMVLVGSINGGQASNLCTYIAKGDVALSVLMTTVTTLGAIVMTPLICKVLLGAIVPVDAVGVAISTIQVVLVPIVLARSPTPFPKVCPAPTHPPTHPPPTTSPSLCHTRSLRRVAARRAACPTLTHTRRPSAQFVKKVEPFADCRRAVRACSSAAPSPSVPRRSSRRA